MQQHHQIASLSKISKTHTSYKFTMDDAFTCIGICTVWHLKGSATIYRVHGVTRRAGQKKEKRLVGLTSGDLGTFFQPAGALPLKAGEITARGHQQLVFSCRLVLSVTSIHYKWRCILYSVANGVLTWRGGMPTLVSSCTLRPNAREDSEVKGHQWRWLDPAQSMDTGS